MRRIQSTASAAPTSTFFGSHPRRAQVPPNGLESTIATCHPASRHRDATVEAADPVPIAITSNFLVTLFTPAAKRVSTRSSARFFLAIPATLVCGKSHHWESHSNPDPFMSSHDSSSFLSGAMRSWHALAEGSRQRNLVVLFVNQDLANLFAHSTR